MNTKDKITVTESTDNVSDIDIVYVPSKKDFLAEVVYVKDIDAMTPGYQVEFDPEEAEIAGFFPEDAITEEDAIESVVDLTDIG